MSRVKLFSDITEATTDFYKKFETASGVTLGLTVLLSLTIGLYALVKIRKPKNLPPGPLGLPLFGYFPFFLKRDPVGVIKELSKKYGNVIGLYLGRRYVVFLNDWSAITEALDHNATLDKPSETFQDIPYKLGVSGVNGQEWVESRRLSSKAMKDGLQKDNWEDLVQEEISQVMKQLEMEKGEPVDPRNVFCVSFTNNVMSLLMGEHLSVGNEATKMVTQSVYWILEYSSNFNLARFSPKLAKVFLALGLAEDSKLGEKMVDFAKFLSDIVDSKIQGQTTYSDHSLITRFQKEVENYIKSKPDSKLTDDSVKGTIMAVIAGGSETTATTFFWLLIALAEHQDIQMKVQEELDRVIGRDGIIRWADRGKVPYTYATLLEVQRWKTITPFPSMRVTTKNIKVQGYDIPVGTQLINSFCLVHLDEKYWKDPDQFHPERFLMENGSKVNAAPDSYIPFSYGKRNCPGKLLAQMQLLQYFCALMQKFKVLPKEGDKVQYKEGFALSYYARDFELRFIPRE